MKRRADKMGNLELFNRNGVFYADSRDVAKMIDRRHSDLLESIEGYIQYLENGKFRSQDFFVPSAYKSDGNNKNYGCYFLTRRGCDMVANKMTGEKGVLFTAAYVTKFEEMEKRLIAKHDSYTIEDPIERAQRWIEEQKERKLLSDKLEEQKPKVIFADAVSVSNKDILVRQMAKILHQNGIEIGERRLFQWLRDKSYLEKYRNFPTQKAMELGLFKVQETAVTHSSGSVTTSFTPKVTPKGCLYFINKFLEVREKVI
jgi:Rha family phage regulatory protein